MGPILLKIGNVAGRIAITATAVALGLLVSDMLRTKTMKAQEKRLAALENKLATTTGEALCALEKAEQTLASTHASPEPARA